MAGLRFAIGRAGGCVDVELDAGRTALRTSLLLQKNDPLEPGGVTGRSVNLGLRGVLSSSSVLARSGISDAGGLWGAVACGGGCCCCSGGRVSKGTTSAKSLVRALTVLVDPPSLGSLFSMFLWKVSAAMTVRSSSDINDTCNSFINAMNWLSTFFCSSRSSFLLEDMSLIIASSLQERSTDPPTFERYEREESVRFDF